MFWSLSTLEEFIVIYYVYIKTYFFEASPLPRRRLLLKEVVMDRNARENDCHRLEAYVATQAIISPNARTLEPSGPVSR